MSPRFSCGPTQRTQSGRPVAVVTASVNVLLAAVVTSTSVAAPSVRRFATRLPESSAARTATIGLASSSMRRCVATSFERRRAAPPGRDVERDVAIEPLVDGAARHHRLRREHERARLLRAHACAAVREIDHALVGRDDRHLLGRRRLGRDQAAAVLIRVVPVAAQTHRSERLDAVGAAERLGGASDDLARVGGGLRMRHAAGAQADDEQHGGESFR